MKYTHLKIKDILLLEPDIFRDERGSFYEGFNQKEFDKILGKKISFVQDNYSNSKKNTLRGLHFQIPPKSQGKLVQVLQGEIFDVVVDLRKRSSTFGSYVTQKLDSVTKKQLWIPEGFAHGFLVLSDSAEVMYKTTDFYHPNSEISIIWNDPILAINWPKCPNILMSDKDKKGSVFLDINYFNS
ncbi:dTDP-4-dehydrorhamnose 3,5-epimerase [Nitrosomonadales bacterium]|nr:dTDP-4-dehydrorhamnose 3,5-epimerase [Nitrosomonadales bacterium]